MPEVTKITDHADRAKARLIQQSRDKTRIRQLLDALNEQSQDYEDDIFPLFQLLDIDAMEGAQLDGIGEIVGLTRDGRSDVEYRTALRQKIGINTSSGTPDEIISVFAIATGSTLVSIQYFEDHPAKFGIYGDAASYPADIASVIQSVSPAAVGVGIYHRLRQEGSADLITQEGGGAIFVNSP